MLRIQGAPKLENLKEEIGKYLETMAFFIGGDVEVVDDKLIKIAGTSFYEEVDEGECKKNIYKEVLETKVVYIIQETKKDKVCIECLGKKKCIRTLDIAVPMFYRKKIIGVMGIYCSSEEDKKAFLKKYERSMGGISDFIKLIISRVTEEWIKRVQSEREDIFNPFIDSFTNGVLLIDKNGLLMRINNFGLKELKLSPKHYGEKIIINDKKEEKYNKKIYNINIGDKVFKLIGKIISIGDKRNNYYTIFIFDKLEKLENKFYEQSKERNLTVDFMIGKSERMLFLKEKIKKISQTKSTVFITGESGTGKELVARAIHAHSERKDRPFIPINCGAIPDALLESELFGYVKGAFSGANPNGKIGKFESANGGVIFLDEIGDMPLYLQVKLLRVLQERKLVRIGSNSVTELDIRIIAATNVDIKKKVEEKKFREDLYYRLNVIPMEVPKLRERGNDTLLIMEHLLEKYNDVLNKYVHTVDEEVKNIIMNYSWPGNVRELENIVEFMVNLSDERGIITKDMIPNNILLPNDREYLIKGDDILTLEETEKKMIKNAVNKYGRDTKGKKKASDALGIGIATLYRKIEKYNIN